MRYSDISLNGIDSKGQHKNYKLNDFKGEKVVVYFYPKDETSLCTKEACDFRDKLQTIQQNGQQKIRIVGVSPDSIESHKHFHEKENLNFVLLSDPDMKLAKAMGVDEPFRGLIARTTFLIDENGNIVKEWERVKVDGHAEDVMKNMMQ